MTCSSNCGCGSSCPEPVAVSVTTTVIQIDDAPVINRTQRVTFSSSSLADDKVTITLDYPAYEARSIDVAKNSGVQRYGVDFTVLGDQVIMTQALIDGDEVYLRYWSVDGTTAISTADIGSLLNSASSDLEDQGYLLMDGTSDHSKTAFADLWVFLQANPDLYISASSAGSTFRLTQLKSVFHNGSTLVTMNTHIKASTAAIA